MIGSAVIGLRALNASFITYISAEGFLPILTFPISSIPMVGGSGSNKGVVPGEVLMWGVWTLCGSIARFPLPATMEVKRGEEIEAVSLARWPDPASTMPGLNI